MHFDGANDLVRVPDGRDLAGVDPVIDGPLGLEAENAHVRGGAAIALALPRYGGAWCQFGMEVLEGVRLLGC